jgi:hypothetical protein
MLLKPHRWDGNIIIINIKDWTLWSFPSPELQLLSPTFLRSSNCSPSLWPVVVWFQGDSVYVNQSCVFSGPEVSYHQTYSATDWLSILRTHYPTQNLQRKHRRWKLNTLKSGGQQVDRWCNVQRAPVTNRQTNQYWECWAPYYENYAWERRQVETPSCILNFSTRQSPHISFTYRRLLPLKKGHTSTHPFNKVNRSHHLKMVTG